MKPISTNEKPNILYILADDMGYGDLSCLNPDSKIHTPHLDALAANGMKFTDAHSSSAVCTPSRYSILTGRYNWRSILKQGVCYGYDAPIIEPDLQTLPSYLQLQGYQTACMGKWHLGWNWGKKGSEKSEVDYTLPMQGGPIDCGFDSFYGIAASLDMPPYVYVENNLPTAIPDRVIPQNTGLAYWREGPIAPDFNHEACLPELTRRAVAKVHELAKNDAPYFMYFALPAPHTPILPSAEFQGASGLSPYGDFCLMVDDVVRQIREAVEATGKAEDTLIIFTSDNGCSPSADIDGLISQGHHPSYIFRGHKADIYEGGHRIPLLMEWPSSIPAGGESAETVCLSDLFATCTEIIGQPCPETAAVDSVSNISLMTGQSKGPVREATIHHSIDGSFSIRKGPWKLEMCPGSGGWSFPKPGENDQDLPPLQLYNLEQDVGETKNLASLYPEIVEELKTDLTRIVNRGRSTPGPDQPNTADLEWPQLWWMLSQ